MAVSTVHLRLGTAPVTVAVGIVLTPTPRPTERLWERAATNVEPSFTGPLARSLPLVAMVLGGVMFGEQGRRGS